MLLNGNARNIAVAYARGSVALREQVATKYVLVLYSGVDIVLDTRRVHAFVTTHVASAVVRDCGLKHMTYTLPGAWTAKAAFLNAFDRDKERLGLIRADVFSSSLEDVFFDMINADAKATVDGTHDIPPGPLSRQDSDDDLLLPGTVLGDVQSDAREQCGPARDEDTRDGEDDVLLEHAPSAPAREASGRSTRAVIPPPSWRQRVVQQGGVVARKRWQIIRRDPQAHASHMWLPLLFAVSARTYVYPAHAPTRRCTISTPEPIK